VTLSPRSLNESFTEVLGELFVVSGSAINRKLEHPWLLSYSHLGDFERLLRVFLYRISQAANSRHAADGKTENTSTFCQANSRIGTHNDTGWMRPRETWS
jgi:hypothetical protein